MNGDKTWKIERFESLTSTNDYVKEKRREKENLIVIARSQTGGRGTKGRSFSSEKGGIYVSVLTHYQDLCASDAFRIMQGAAAAVCETLYSFGLTPQIKWPNDIFVNGKKICGILIENTFSGKNVASSVVGIGLNVSNRLPKELSLIATSMHAESSKACSVEEVEERLLANLTETGIENKYETYLGFMGEEVTLILGEERILATLLFVDERGNLVARTAEGEKRFSSAEVSLRIKGENVCV